MTSKKGLIGCPKISRNEGFGVEKEGYLNEGIYK